MDAQPPAPQPEEHRAWTRAEIAYASVLFVLAVAVLAFALARRGEILPSHGPGVALFFFCYGLFTITIGYRHPNFGYYSFDRVSQVASMLVLGPVDAAWINGLASLVYPLHRLWRGVPLPNVIFASLNNAGIMTLIILASGYLYLAVGGEVPLISLDGQSIAALVVLVLSMQLLNDVAMLGLLRVRGGSLVGFFSMFSYALELGAGATAVLVALVYSSMDVAVFALLLGVLSIGMVALQQFANMRYKLEIIVAARTRSLREKTLELERQATHDNLTGLFNRRYADAYLAQQLELARRQSQHLTVALADIDLFKQINDLHSHATGDEVLRRVAAILRERCRKTDMIARYGGEEFLLCFPHTDLREARALCENLRAAVEGASWARLGLAAGVTISFGIAVRGADSSFESLLRLADERLYQAKNNGRNRVVA